MYFSIPLSFYPLINLKGPKGPEPAPGFFEKKTPDCPTWVVNSKAKQQKLAPNEPGVARTFFSFYVIIITSTLRFRLRYRSGRTFFFYVTLP
jgi:hypothetical protein